MLLYIDPGAGSMVIQAVLAAVLAIPFIFRSALTQAVHRLKSSMRRSEPPIDSKGD